MPATFRLLISFAPLFAVLFPRLSAGQTSRPRYVIAAEWHPGTQRIVGSVELSLRSQDSIVYFDVGPNTSIDPDSTGHVRTEGQRVAVVRSRSGSSANVIRLRFATRWPGLADGLGYVLFDARTRDGLWYPRLVRTSVADAYADYDLSIVVPDSIDALLPGLRTVSAGPSSRTRRIRHEIPDLEGAPLVMGSGFRVTSTTLGGVQINVFDRIHADSTLGDIASPTGRSIEWYTRTLGFFPYPAVGIVPGYLGAIGGNGMPGIFTIHRGYRSADFYVQMTAHEVGHFYWGHGILGDKGPGDYSWLMLANGMWTDHLYTAQVNNIEFAEQWYRPDLFNMPEHFFTAQVAGHEQRLGLPDEERTRLTTNYGGLVEHAKAAVGIQLIAQRLGTSAYLELQKRLLRDYWHRVLDADAFGRELVKAGAPGADQWLALWRRGDARIAYDVDFVRRLPGSTPRYLIRLARTGTVSVPFEVAVHGVRGDSVRTRAAGAAFDTLTVELASDFKSVVLDPDGYVPMWGSGNWRAQGSIVRAMLASGIGNPAVDAAFGHLQRFPQDSHTRSVLMVRLSNVGDHAAAIRLGTAGGFSECDSRTPCRGLMAMVRSYWSVGDTAAARTIFDRIRANAPRQGALAEWRATERLIQVPPL